jgi:hypothetical protein
MAGVDRRTKLLEQHVSGHSAHSHGPAAIAERLVVASLEPGAVVSSQIPTQLLATHTAGAVGGRIPFETAHHSGMMSPTVPRWSRPGRAPRHMVSMRQAADARPASKSGILLSYNIRTGAPWDTIPPFS